MDFQTVYAGIEASCLYATLALSFFLIVRATRLVNFAVGGYAIFAALAIAYMVMTGLALPVAVFAGLFAAAVMSLMTEYLVRVMQRNQSKVGTMEIAIVAVLFVVEQSAGLAFGRQPSLVQTWIPGSFEVFSTSVSYQSAANLALTLALFAVVGYWLSRTRYGRMLRAVGDNPGAAETLGLPISKVRAVAMILAGLTAGLAGLLATTQASLTVESGTQFTLMGFIALVLGGSAYVWAPLAGGALLGMLEAFSARLIGIEYRDYVLLALVLVVFTFRPKGLFAVKERT